jgi:hypothetical protein
MTHATKNFKCTSIFPGSITKDIVDPSVVLPEIINIIMKEKDISTMMAMTHEFRMNMKRLPQAMWARIDQELNQMFVYCLDLGYRPMFLSMEKERIISYDRIMRLVLDRMKPYFDLERIAKTFDFEILKSNSYRGPWWIAPATRVRYFIILLLRGKSDLMFFSMF